MMRALNTAGSGMLAQQTNLDVLANNLANANTTGFKSQRAQFADLMYQTTAVSSGEQNGRPAAMQVGLGSLWTGNATDVSQGAPVQTNSPLNLAINGQGFFKLVGPDGSNVYTRDGSFTQDATGQLVTQQGYVLEPSVVIPPGSTNVSIDMNGKVTATTPGSSTPTLITTINLTTFPNPAGLTRIGSNLYQEGGGSGSATDGAPGTNGAGTLQAGYIEGSNVQVVNEMVNMITAQRAYEINSKAIQTADAMLQVANNIKQ
ncbi:MAG TPA: flagellar basal-body rod protein FlgG [Fimbriimonadaceae bacterium]|nr:flagellar basal-body rod protein FlgG [Fimbriimonadaceae bacterium]